MDKAFQLYNIYKYVFILVKLFYLCGLEHCWLYGALTHNTKWSKEIARVLATQHNTSMVTVLRRLSS